MNVIEWLSSLYFVDVCHQNAVPIASRVMLLSEM